MRQFEVASGKGCDDKEHLLKDDEAKRDAARSRRMDQS